VVDDVRVCGIERDHEKCEVAFILRCKSQRIKIHFLGNRFSIDSIPWGMVFCLEITNIWHKSENVWFADLFLEIF